jgi:hypothetical protein
MNWTPGAKAVLFIFGALVCLALSLFILGIIRRTWKQVIFQRAAEQIIREIEDRRREVALQWQRLEMERYADHGRYWEIQVHHRIMRYGEQVEEGEFQHFRNTLATGDYAQERERRRSRTDDQGQGEEAKAGNEARESNEYRGGDVEASRHNSIETNLASDSIPREIVKRNQGSSRTEYDGDSSKPLSSDEVLRGVNALGYEFISDSQRTNARARALKDLEGR